MAWARTVAVVVPSPAISEVLLATSLTIWAPMFSNLSSSSISLATVTPSFVMVGEPNDLSSITFLPLGPKVTFTASARPFTPLRSDSLAFWSYRISFAMVSPSLLIFDYGENIIFPEDQVLFAVNFDLCSRVLAEEDLVARLHFRRHSLPLLRHLAAADRDHTTLLGFLLGGIRNNDPPFCLLLFLEPLDNHSVL